MKLLRLREVPQREGDRLFRNASWRSLAMVVLLMAGITGYVAIPKPEPTDPVFIAVPAVATVLLLLLMAVRLAACLRPENWLLRIAPEGLYVHLRSYMNAHLPEESPTVLFLANHEVAGVCLRRENRSFPGRYGGTSLDRYAYVDLVVRFTRGAEDVASLAAVLREERRLPGRKHHDYPVRLVPPQEEDEPALVRLVWDQIRPHETAVATLLGERYTRYPDALSTPKHWDALDSAGKEALIAELWETGRVKDAEQLVRIEHKVGRRGVDAYFKERFGDS